MLVFDHYPQGWHMGCSMPPLMDVHRRLDVSTMHQINMYCCLKKTKTPFTLHKVPTTHNKL